MNDQKYLMHHIEKNAYWQDLTCALEKLVSVYKLDYIENCITQKFYELEKEENGDGDPYDSDAPPIIEICCACKEKDEELKKEMKDKKKRAMKSQVEKRDK